MINRGVKAIGQFSVVSLSLFIIANFLGILPPSLQLSRVEVGISGFFVITTMLLLETMEAVEKIARPVKENRPRREE